jgi:hypothetical protein
VGPEKSVPGIFAGEAARLCALARILLRSGQSKRRGSGAHADRVIRLCVARDLLPLRSRQSMLRPMQGAGIGFFGAARRNSAGRESAQIG